MTRDVVYHRNSIDLLRLIAALQVMLGHAMRYLPDARIEWDIFRVLPGVPLFFFLSGFLIAGSWIRQPDIATFTERRLRRIYPGLFATTALTTIAFAIFLRIEIAQQPGEFVLWLFCQLSFFQSWNASFIKSYGIGYSNVSLWTIPIELVFYAMTPIILTIGKRIGRIAMTIWLLTGLSFVLFIYFDLLYNPVTPSEILVRKIFLQSPLSALSWFWMFGFGMLANHYRAALIPFCVRRFWILLSAWLLIAIVSLNYEFAPLIKIGVNNLGLINFIITGFFALAIAFRLPDLADRLLRGNDLSYGIYIYHIPVLNLILTFGGSGIVGFTALATVTVALAALSWCYIESPLLHRRNSVLLKDATPIAQNN